MAPLSQIHARTLLRSFLALVAGLLLAAPALAVTLPTVSVTEVGGSTWTPSATTLGCGTPDATGAFSCSGTKSSILGGDATAVSWNLNINPDPTVANTIALTNSTATTQTYVVTVALAVTPLSAPIHIGGSLSGSLTDLTGDGVTVGTAGSTAIYTALIDGSPVATLYPAPSSFFAGSYLSAAVPAVAFGTPIPSQLLNQGVSNTIGIQLSFTLTPGDSASFTSVFVTAVPEPGTALLLLAAAAGLVASRRRMATAR